MMILHRNIHHSPRSEFLINYLTDVRINHDILNFLLTQFPVNIISLVNPVNIVCRS